MRECGSGGVLQRQIVLFKTEGIAINMGKQGRPLKTLASGEPDAMAGSGAKRGRDGAASSAAAKAAEVSGDDRFSLSKFQLDERFVNRTKVAVAAKAAAELEMSDEEEEEEEEEFGDDESDDMDDDDDDDDGKDGNYDISEDDDVHGDEEENGGGLEGEVDGDGAADGSSAKLKKIAKKLKPMSPEELAAFMKVAPLPGDAQQIVTQFAGTRAARRCVSQPHSAVHEAHQGHASAVRVCVSA